LTSGAIFLTKILQTDATKSNKNTSHRGKNNQFIIGASLKSIYDSIEKKKKETQKSK
jgi:hypothetical protein